MGSNSKSGKIDADASLLDEGIDFEGKLSMKLKPYDGKGIPTCQSLMIEEGKFSSGPPSPVAFLSLDGRTGTGHKPAEIFRTDLISAMKLPDTQLLNPENYMSITDTWRQEWERGVQVPVHPDSLSQPLVRPVEVYYKKASTFKLSGKLLNSDEKRKGKTPCIYDLNRMDVEWLSALNKSRRNKGKIELEEGMLEKAIAYFEDKCYENMGYAIVTQKGLSIEYDESVCCDICQSPDSEEGNEMVFCDSCDICVHQACYGIQSIPSGSWLCQPCRWGVSTPPCKLCPNKGGAMKKAKGGKTYIHVSCALWVPEVGFGSVERMEPIIKLEKIPNRRWNLICYLCKEKAGACIQCTVKTCVTAFHVTCGFSNALDMKTVLDDNAVDGVRHVSYCGKHGHKNKSPRKSPNKSTNKSTNKSANRSPHRSPQRSPPRSPEKTKQNKEEAENLRQKRLKQMEGEFHKYVDVTEAAKDLTLPKELASHVHAYWTLKRKARDDVPLLPPTSEQQEKLSGKQGAADMSRNLQLQIERLAKMRCDLERLRNLCYMVGKREKMRRELYRVRERVVWKAIDVMTDEAIPVDEQDVNWIRAACRDNLSGDGSAPVEGPDGDDSTLPSDGCSTSSRRSSVASSSQGDAEPQTAEDGGEIGAGAAAEAVREDEDSSDSDTSGSIQTKKRSFLAVGSSVRTSQPQEESKDTCGESNNAPSTPRDSTVASLNNPDEEPMTSPKRFLKGLKANSECSSFDDTLDTPRRSPRILRVECPESSSDEGGSSEVTDKIPSPRTRWKEHVEDIEVPQTPRTRQRTNSLLDSEGSSICLDRPKTRHRTNSLLDSEGLSIGLDGPKTRGKSTEGKCTESDGARSEEVEASPTRSLRSRRHLSYHGEGTELPEAHRSDNDVFSESGRETRATRSRRTSASTSDDGSVSSKPAKLRKIDELAGRTTRLRSASEELGINGTTGNAGESGGDGLARKPTMLRNPSESDSSPARETRSARLRRISSSVSADERPSKQPRSTNSYESDSTENDEVLKENQPAFRRKRAFSDCGLARTESNNFLNKRRKSADVRRRISEDSRANRRSRDKNRNSIRRSVKDNTIINNKQCSITDYLFSGSTKKNRSPKAKFHNGFKSSDSGETDCDDLKSDEENSVDRVQRLTSLRSFTNGKEIVIPDSPCPECQIQHHRHPGYSPEFKDRSPGRRNSRELRQRNSPSPSPRSRGRLSSGLRFSPSRGCGNLLSQVCRAAVA